MRTESINPASFSQHILLFVALSLVVACGSDGKKHKMDLVSTSSIKPRDSLTNAYYNNTLFSPKIIRLGSEAEHSFMFVDSAFFGIVHLSKSDREDYYNKVRKQLPQRDLEVQNLVWSIPELKRQQLGDGGYGSSFSLIAERPTPEKPAEYLVEIHLNNIVEFPLAAPMALFKVDLKQRKVMIADKSGYFVTMNAWRAANK